MTRRDNPHEKKIVEGKVFAILSYLSILCIVPLLLKKDNDFVLSHGKQGLVIFVGEVGIFVISIVPFLAWLLQLGMFILGGLSFLGIIAVLKGQYLRLPFIADIADQITL